MPNITFNRTTTLSFPGSNIPDITNGIVNGSLAVREILCADRIVFGDVNANQFQCQLYDCPNLLKKKIQVKQSDNGTTKVVFTGWVTSCKTDDLTGFKIIEAYDYFYKARTKKIKKWWKSYWTDRTSSTIGAMWRNMLSYYNIPYTDTSLIFDNRVMQKKQAKKLKTVYMTGFLNQLCEINMCIPNFNREGTLEFIKFSGLSSSNAIDIRDYYMISTSKFEEEVHTPFDKVELFNDKNNSGESVGEGDNVLSIENNIFLYGMTTDDLVAAADTILTNMYSLEYVTGDITMKVSNLDIKLGDVVRVADKNNTERYCLVCENNYKGSLLVDQSITSNYEDAPTIEHGVYGNTLSRNENRLEYEIDGKSTTFLDEEMPVDGQDGDLWVTPYKEELVPDFNLKKTYSCWSFNNWSSDAYIYWDLTINCKNGDFVAYGNTIRGRATFDGKTYSEWNVVFLFRVLKGDTPDVEYSHSITGMGSTALQYDMPQAILHQPTRNGTDHTPYFLQNDDPSKYVYDPDFDYYTINFTTGTMQNSVDSSDQLDYLFMTTHTDILRDIKDKVIEFPPIRYVPEITDDSLKYHDDTNGGWKDLSYVRKTEADESEEAGGSDFNGVSVTTNSTDGKNLKIGLKPNVMRAWFKADPPQVKRKFNQYCVRFTGKPDTSLTITPFADHEGWENENFKQDKEGVLTIKSGGTTDTSKTQWCSYKIEGLTSGKKYYFNFACSFKNGTSFGNNFSKGLGLVFSSSNTLPTITYSGEGNTFDETNLYYSMRRWTTTNFASFSFEATASTMYMYIVIDDINNGQATTLTLSKMVISQSERAYVRSFYIFDTVANTWLPYKPFGSGSDDSGEGARSLDDLDDVSIDNLQNGQILYYNSVTGQWTNGAAYTLPIASANTLGGIKVGNRLSIDQNGVLSADDQSYTLPIASAGNLGGIKVGQNLSIDENGVLSATGGGGGASNLDDLGDVTISNPSSGQVLKYNGSSWVNEAGGGGSSDLEAIDLNQSQYNALTPEEKEDLDKMYFITDGNSDGTINNWTISALAYKQLTPVQYEALSTAQKNDGTVYFVSDDAVGVYGLKVITITTAEYEALTPEQKNNGIPYFVHN